MHSVVQGWMISKFVSCVIYSSYCNDCNFSPGPGGLRLAHIGKTTTLLSDATCGISGIIYISIHFNLSFSLNLAGPFSSRVLLVGSFSQEKIENNYILYVIYMYVTDCQWSRTLLKLLRHSNFVSGIQRRNDYLKVLVASVNSSLRWA